MWARQAPPRCSTCPRRSMHCSIACVPRGMTWATMAAMRVGRRSSLRSRPSRRMRRQRVGRRASPKCSTRRRGVMVAPPRGSTPPQTVWAARRWSRALSKVPSSRSGWARSCLHASRRSGARCASIAAWRRNLMAGSCAPACSLGMSLSACSRYSVSRATLCASCLSATSHHIRSTAPSTSGSGSLAARPLPIMWTRRLMLRRGAPAASMLMRSYMLACMEQSSGYRAVHSEARRPRGQISYSAARRISTSVRPHAQVIPPAASRHTRIGCASVSTHS